MGLQRRQSVGRHSLCDLVKLILDRTIILNTHFAVSYMYLHDDAVVLLELEKNQGVDNKSSKLPTRGRHPTEYVTAVVVHILLPRLESSWKVTEERTLKHLLAQSGRGAFVGFASHFATQFRPAANQNVKLIRNFAIQLLGLTCTT